MTDKKKKPAKKSNKQVMDVSKPGKTAPSASSRPIILGHRPTVKDPMVSEDNKMPDNESEEHKIEVKRSGPKVIAPLSSAEELSKEQKKEPKVEPASNEMTDGQAPKLPIEEAVPEPEEPEADAAAEKPAEEPPAEERVEEAEPEESEVDEPVADEASVDDNPGKSSKDKKEPKDKGSSIVDAIAGQAAKNKDKKDDKKNEELQKRLAAVEKLVDDKKYFVKTSSTSKKERKTRWTILLLSLLLLIAGYLVVDAQLIKNDYWLPYHFFKEEKQQPTAGTPVSPEEGTANEREQAAEEGAYTGQMVESAKKGFSIKIPDGWKIILVEDGDALFSEFRGTSGDIFSDALEYKPGAKPTIEKLPMLGTDAPIRFSVSYRGLDADYDAPDDTYAKSDFTTDAGVKGTRYFKQIPLDLESEPFTPAEKQYVYEFKTTTRRYHVTYRILEKTAGEEDGLTASDKNRLELVEQVIKTLIFK